MHLTSLVWQSKLSNDFVLVEYSSFPRSTQTHRFNEWGVVGQHHLWEMKITLVWYFKGIIFPLFFIWNTDQTDSALVQSRIKGMWHTGADFEFLGGKKRAEKSCLMWPRCLRGSACGVRLTCPRLSSPTRFMSQGVPKSSLSSFLMVTADSLCLLSVLLSVLQHVNSDA